MPTATRAFAASRCWHGFSRRVGRGTCGLPAVTRPPILRSCRRPGARRDPYAAADVAGKDRSRRSRKIIEAVVMGPGVRRDDGGYSWAISRHDLPEFCISFALSGNPRAQGRPGARCPRGLACKWETKRAHTSIQVQRRASGLPCAMALRFTSCSPRRTALLPPSSPGISPAQLDASTATSGPHDFTVRAMCVRPAHQTSTASHRAFVTIASAPRNG